MGGSREVPFYTVGGMRLSVLLAGALLAQIGRPSIHDPAPPLEQVRSRVGRFRLVRKPMRERSLCDFARLTRVSAPITERRPESVQGRGNSGFSKQLCQRHVRERSPGARSRKHQGAAITELACLAQDIDSSITERQTMLDPRLHSSCRHRPGSRVQINLVPFGSPRLQGPGAGQHRKLEQELGLWQRFGSLHRGDRASDARVWYRAMMLLRPVISGERAVERFSGGIVGTVSLGNPPLHHGADALAYPSSRFGAGVPDR